MPNFKTSVYTKQFDLALIESVLRAVALLQSAVWSGVPGDNQRLPGYR